MTTAAASHEIARTIADDDFRPALRAVFQRGPDGLTLHWVAERERRDGEIQIVIGDLIPGPATADLVDTPIAAD
jgi:hypothetical protein